MPRGAFMICTLCPRMCRANRAVSQGFCRLGDHMLIARIAPHLWEEPPISGKKGTGAVFFSGCTLRCAYCQNGEISHRNAGKVFTPAALSDALKRLTDQGVHTISFITGTPFVPMILDTLDRWCPPVPLVWNTSGYETVETLRMLEGVMDVYLPDLKHFLIQIGDPLGTGRQLCNGFILLRYFLLVFHLVFQTCPEVHGNRTQLDFDLHVALLVLQEDRNRDDQVETAVAVRLRIFYVILAVYKLDVILLQEAVGDQIDIRRK